jgi:hypothetical protein
MRGVGELWDYGSIVPWRRKRKVTRRRSTGKVWEGDGGPDAVGWATMLSLVWTSPSISTSLKHSEGGNTQERMITCVGVAEQRLSYRGFGHRIMRCPMHLVQFIVFESLVPSIKPTHVHSKFRAMALINRRDG